MRKWHRWISIFFGVFMVWIAVTGILSQVFVLWPSGTEGPPAMPATPEGFTCPEGWRCMPAAEPSGLRSLVGLMHHLHSGESFGAIGTAISVLSGFALLFFAISGLWLYIRMWRHRAGRGLKGGMFWK